MRSPGTADDKSLLLADEGVWNGNNSVGFSAVLFHLCLLCVWGASLFLMVFRGNAQLDHFSNRNWFVKPIAGVMFLWCRIKKVSNSKVTGLTYPYLHMNHVPHSITLDDPESFFQPRWFVFPTLQIVCWVLYCCKKEGGGLTSGGCLGVLVMTREELAYCQLAEMCHLCSLFMQVWSKVW